MRAFISHNSGDKAVAETFALALHDQGVDPWLDKWEIYAGESLMDRIETGLREASAFVILLSPRSAGSRWVREELRVALQKRLLSDDFRILPVLVEDCDIPLFLLDYRYIDARSDISAAIADLIVAIKRIPLRPVFLPDSHPPKISFKRVSYHVALSGPFGQVARFRERFQALAQLAISQIDRSIDPCGRLLDVTSSPFPLSRKVISGVIEKWTITPPGAIAPGTLFEYDIAYTIRDAFPAGQRSWTYAIEAPTERLEVAFDFHETDAPAAFQVFHRIGQTLYPEPTQPTAIDRQFHWSKFVPGYKDTYEFTFDWA